MLFTFLSDGFTAVTLKDEFENFSISDALSWSPFLWVQTNF